MFLVDPVSRVESPVKEYHSKIPVHCFGFTIERTKPESGYEQYIPVEFEIIGDHDITKEKILPLMPIQQKDENGKDIKDKLFYKHISPVAKITSKENLTICQCWQTNSG